MSLISEYLKKISEKNHSSEHDANIPPMLFDNNQSNLHKKKIKGIILIGVIFIVIISGAGYFLKNNQSALGIKKVQSLQATELMPVQKPVIKPEPEVAKVKQAPKEKQIPIVKLEPKTLIKKSEKIVKPDNKRKLNKIDQLTISVGGGDDMKSVGLVGKSDLDVEENKANDRADIKFQNRQKKGYKLYFNLGLGAQKNKDYNKAEEYYKKSLNIKPDYKKSLINLSSIYIKTGDNDQAIVLLQKLIVIDPDNIDASVNLGIAYLKQEYFDQAEELLAGAVEKDQNNTNSLYNLAVLYQKTDQLDKAVNLYEKVFNIDPENIKSCLACSSIYEKRKNFEKAVEKYKKCLATAKVNQSYKLRQKILYRIKLLQAIIESEE